MSGTAASEDNTVHGYQPVYSQPPVSSTNGHEDAAGAIEKSLPPTPSVKSGAEEKKEMMERLQPAKGAKATDVAQRKGDRWARDPTTGVDVLIKDPEFEDFRQKGLDNESLDPSGSKAGPSLNKPRDPSRQDHRFPAPAVADVGNICLQPFPPPVDPVDISKAKAILRSGAGVTSALCAFTWFFVATGAHVSWLAFFWRTALLGALAAVAWIGAENAGRKIEKELERVRINMHTQRAQEHSPPTPESVEWLNAIIKLVWGLINPEMFIPIVDMVEDVLQQSLPGFVDAVRITDIGQGTNPLRVVAMRALPDQPGKPGYPREEWVGLDADTQSRIKAEEASKGQPNSGDPAKTLPEEDTEQTGDYLNYEVSVSYQALPGQGNKLRFHNMHLMLQFFIGAMDWFKIPVPIYAIVEGFVATVRMRVQFIQNPPFVRNLTVTLMGVPKVEVSVEPFTKKLPNVLDLPLIKNFVEMGIAAACAQYIAPRSLTINLAQMLAGDGIKKDTKALGVLVVTVHHAVDLTDRDKGGLSDPYIVLAFAKFGKPLYSTRVITGDLNPVWEETAFLLVTDEEVKGDELLSATLWDSDKHTADDLVGRVSVPLTELMKEPGKMHQRVDRLQGFEDANQMPGTLTWSVGYYQKMPLNQKLKVEPGANAPKEIKEKEEMQQDKGTVADSKDEADALRIPPDPNVPTGILSVIIHQINNLERQDIKGSTGNREGQMGQDTSEPAEEGSNLPNSYCEIIINDDMVYKTRVKQYTSMPYFEAGTERFVRNWKDAVVRIQVRDARVREKDPVLGIVTVRLADLFKNSSEVTRLFSIEEGIGYGRVNVSFLLRQVKTDIPRELCGWDTGTVEILDNIHVESTDEYDFKTKKLVISTSEEEYKAPTSSATVTDGDIHWDLPVDKVRLPVYNRYASAVLFEIGSGGFGPLGQDSDFVAVQWLKDIPDEQETRIRIPVVKSKDLEQLRQNYINDQCAATHKYEIVGWLTCSIILDSGLDPDHSDHQDSRDDKHRYEAYDRVEGQATTAEKNAERVENGDFTKKDQKALDSEKKHQLHMRHRGVMQFAPARTALWSKEGIKQRAHGLKNLITGDKDRKPTVESEA